MRHRLIAPVLAGCLAGCEPAPPRDAGADHDPRAAATEQAPIAPARLSGAVRPSRVAAGPLSFAPVLDLPRVGSREIVTGGSAVLDFDLDGDLDVFLPLVGAPSPMLRNEGDFRFTPLTGELGLPLVRAYGAALGDCDGDGLVDLLLEGVDRFALARDLGGRFEEVPFPPLPFRASSSLFFDADGDGDLDLYVTCYFGSGGGPCGDRLLINDGACHFADETATRGPVGTGIGHAVGFLDVEGDGDPDLLVGNDAGFEAVPDQLLENDGTGHFTPSAPRYGLDQAAFSMSVEVADLDGDGRLDVYKGNICRSPLLVNAGAGLPFADGGRTLGLPTGWILAPDQPPLVLPPVDGLDPAYGEARFILEYMQDRPDPLARCLTSWATEAADLDADGRPELFVANGAVGHRYESDRMPDQLFWRPPDSTSFREIGESAGLDDTGRGRTAVFADLDGDARLDLVLGNAEFGAPRDTPGRVFANRSREVGRSLFVTLLGPGANRDGIGAVVQVTAGGRTQVAQRTFSTSFLAASAAPMHFGLGDAAGAEAVVVRWPWRGGVDVIRDVPAGAVRVAFGSGR